MADEQLEPVAQQSVAPAPQPPAAVQETAAPGSVVQPQVEDDEKFFSALGYFGFLFVVPLIVKPKSAYCKFHAKQSMVLFLVFFVSMIILATLHLIGSLLMLVIFAIYIIAIYRAYKGDMWNIPIISNFAGKMDLNALYSKAGLAVSSVSGLKEKAAGMASKAGDAVQSMGKQEGGPTEQPPVAQK